MMNNTDKSFLAKPEVQQNMMKLMGIANATNKKQISEEQKKQIVKKYVNMFFSLACINWCNGATLGQAWQKALDTMGEYIKSKTKVLNHPINLYLVAIHARYRRHVAESLLTSPHAGEKLNLGADVKSQWKSYSSKCISGDMKFFDDLHKEYMPEQHITKLNSAEPFKQAQDKAIEKMQRFIALQQLRVRAA